MIKEAQPNKIYTEQFLYLNTDVHIFRYLSRIIFRGSW